jgi:hypothetical protein
MLTKNSSPRIIMSCDCEQIWAWGGGGCTGVDTSLFWPVTAMHVALSKSGLLPMGEMHASIKNLEWKQSETLQQCRHLSIDVNIGNSSHLPGYLQDSFFLLNMQLFRGEMKPILVPLQFRCMQYAMRQTSSFGPQMQMAQTRRKKEFLRKLTRPTLQTSIPANSVFSSVVFRNS